MLVDTHAHLMFEQFTDLTDVLQRSRDAGVKKIVNVGCTIESSQQSFDMCQQYENMWGTLGVHPYDAHLWSGDVMNTFFDQAKSNARIVALGETGLDYHLPGSQIEKQQASFRDHLKLAEELNLPVVVHTREAYADMLKILREFPKVRCIMHCFSGDLEFAEEVLKIGEKMLAFGGVITFSSAEMMRKVAAWAPADRLLTETDCPYLAPQSHRGERNEPSYMVETVKKIAEVRGVSYEEISELTSRNAERFLLI